MVREALNDMRGDGHIETGKALLAKGREELDKGDFLQASEKLWGAAAHMVKGVAERRGWEHNSHRLLIDVVSRLARENSDDDLVALFHIAQSLHINFYENWHSREFIEVGARRIEEFVAKMGRL